MVQKILSAVALSCLALLSACEINSPEYNADYLLPLVKTQVGIEDVDEIGAQEYEFLVTMNDVDHIITNTSVPVPPITATVPIGPLPLTDDQDAFIRAKLDTAEFELVVKNYFPININAGTHIIISNENPADPTNKEVFRYVLTEDIGPYGDSANIKVLITSSDWIYNDLEITLENFSTDGSNGSVVSFAAPNNRIEFVFRIDVLKINEIEVEPGKTYVLNETFDVEIGDEEGSTNIERGFLTLYLKNGFPANFRFEGRFLDQNNQVVDEQLVLPLIVAPEVNNNGYVGNPATIREEKIVTEHTQASWKVLQTRTRKMQIYGVFSVVSPPGVPVIKIRNRDNVPLQLVGDISVAVTP